MRTLNAGALALLARIEAGERIAMVQLVQLTADETLYLTTAGSDIVWGGQTWLRASVVVEPIDDTRGELAGLTLSLPAVDSAQIALALTAAVEGGAVAVYDALVDPDTGAVADAVLAWSGTLNVPSFEDGPDATISITAEHRGVSALRSKPSRYTDDEQRRLYPGDTSLDFDPATDSGPLAWPAASYFKRT